MGEAGFDGARCVGAGNFWSSPTKRSMDFVAVKSAAAPLGVRRARQGLQAKHLVVVGVAALAAVVVARLWVKRS